MDGDRETFLARVGAMSDADFANVIHEAISRRSPAGAAEKFALIWLTREEAGEWAYDVVAPGPAAAGGPFSAAGRCDGCAFPFVSWSASPRCPVCGSPLSAPPG